MSDNEILYLSRADVEAVNLEMSTIIKLLEQAFMDKGTGKGGNASESPVFTPCRMRSSMPCRPTSLR